MQPVPKVSQADVDRVVLREFGAGRVSEINEILAAYGTETWEPGTYRVRLAALKLANGDAKSLRKIISRAKGDFRDVVAYAEYPEYMKHLRPPSGEEQAIIERDWCQYQDWLRRG